MLKFISFIPAQYFLRLFQLVIAVLLVTAPQLNGQTNNQQGTPKQTIISNLLPENLGEHWRAIGAARTLSAAESAILPDAEIHNEYGLLARAHRVYTNGSNQATVELFRTRYASGAYGLFTFNRGNIGPQRQEFYQGRYLISIASENADQATISSLVEALKQIIPADAEEMVVLPSHLPERNKIADTEKYLVGSAALGKLANFGDLREVVDFVGGAEAVTAEYQNGEGQMNLLIVEYHTPQLATDGYARFQQYFDGLSQAEKEQRLLRRIGNYVIAAVGIQDRATAENLIGQIKYTPKVYWEGRRMRDIPLEFRPPDPAAIEEATRTTQIIFRALFWISAMLLGVVSIGIITGGAFFYWRRYQRRKLGLDDFFSDAGDTIRLNLDDYLLSPGETTVKRIGKGEK